MITNLTTKQIESIQIDEGVIFLNYGETDERLLAPPGAAESLPRPLPSAILNLTDDTERQRAPRLSRSRARPSR